MSWIASLEIPGHITEALIYFNQATDMLERGASSVEVSQFTSTIALLSYSVRPGLSESSLRWSRSMRREACLLLRRDQYQLVGVLS